MENFKKETGGFQCFFFNKSRDTERLVYKIMTRQLACGRENY